MLRRWMSAWLHLNPSRIFLEQWLARSVEGRDTDFLVLDAGAGDAPYRSLFSDVAYETCDFAMVDHKPYTDLTYVCDLTDIPVEGGRYDLVICTQVLEHVPDPSAVLREFRRIVKDTGEVWLSAPLFYEEHEEPYDYYRFTQFALRRLAQDAGFEVRELAWLEGYYTTLAYQLSIAARQLPTWMLPIRLCFGLLSGAFARLDLSCRSEGRGMCKNYRTIMIPRTLD